VDSFNESLENSLNIRVHAYLPDPFYSRFRNLAMSKSQYLIRAVSAGLGLALAGCMPMVMNDTRPQVAPTSPFDEAALRSALEPGQGELAGQAFKRTVGGEVRYAAGVPVYLVPVTPYVRECMAIAGSYARSDCGPRLIPYRKQTIGNGEGRFRFQELKPGDYYVETTITWGVPTQLGVQTTGGTINRMVTIPDSPTPLEIVLTD
jgi:hypothetical protein